MKCSGSENLHNIRQDEKQTDISQLNQGDQTHHIPNCGRQDVPLQDIDREQEVKEDAWLQGY